MKDVFFTLNDAVIAYENYRTLFDEHGRNTDAVLARKCLQKIITIAKEERLSLQNLRKIKLCNDN